MTVGLSELFLKCDFTDAGPLATLEVFNEQLPEGERRTEDELGTIYAQRKDEGHPTREWLL